MIRKRKGVYSPENVDPPMFSTLRRPAIFAGAVLFVILCLTTYFYTSLRPKTDVETVDDLSGQRIGCCSGWEVDYLLTPRKDLTLQRYDTNADCILALCYGQVDAIGLDEMTATTLLQKVTGVTVLSEPIAAVGCTFYVSRQNEELLADFNDFARSFIESDDYRDFHDRAVFNDGDTFEQPEIELPTTGTHITVGYVPDCFPECYYDFTTGGIKGYGVEMVERFAADRGYVIDWVETTDADAMVQLSLNRMDMCAAYMSDIYREETERGTSAHMTDAFLFCEIHLVTAAPGEQPRVTGTIED